MKKNNLFSELSPEEAANVSGGGLFEAAAYLTVMNALFPYLAGSPEVINTAFLFLIDALSVSETGSKSSVNDDANVEKCCCH
ncbi:MAG: hypothetical protein ACKO9I_22965 [Sphaerospermopsis kisseleviana]